MTLLRCPVPACPLRGQFPCGAPGWGGMRGERPRCEEHDVDLEWYPYSEREEEA